MEKISLIYDLNNFHIYAYYGSVNVSFVEILVVCVFGTGYATINSIMRKDSYMKNDNVQLKDVDLFDGNKEATVQAKVHIDYYYMD